MLKLNYFDILRIWIAYLRIFPLTFPHFLRNDDDFFPWYIKMDLFLSQFLSSSHFLRNVDAIFSWCIEMHLFLSFDLSSVVKVRSQKIQTCSEKFLTITVVFRILLSSSLCVKISSMSRPFSYKAHATLTGKNEREQKTSSDASKIPLLTKRDVWWWL